MRGRRDTRTPPTTATRAPTRSDTSREAAGGLDLPTLGRLGLGSVLALAGVAPAADPVLHGRLRPLGPGKDSTTGHWELMGVVAPAPLPTYPDGFPPAIVERIASATGRGVLCNAAANGVEAIVDWGERHLETGDLIVYTSVDSVLQIAAHVDVVPPDELYERVRGGPRGDVRGATRWAG